MIIICARCNRKHIRTKYYQKINCYSYYDTTGKQISLDKPIEIIMVNISLGGAGLICEKKFEAGTVFVLNFYLDRIPYNQLFKILWCEKAGEMYRVGTEIINISTNLFKHLKEYELSDENRFIKLSLGE